METKTYKYKHSPCFNYSLKDVTKFKKKIKNEFYSNVKYHEYHSGEYTNKKIGGEKDRYIISNILNIYNKILILL